MNKASEIKLQKNKMRRAALLCRQGLAQKSGSGIGVHLAEIFFNDFVATADLTVAGYWPIGSEADVKPLLTKLHQKDTICFLPVIIGRGEALHFRKWQPNDKLVMSDLGILEPAAVQPMGTPNMVLVPLLAFDMQGYRIGYGGGFYDRTLQVMRSEARNRNQEIIAIGIGYAGQKVESVPHDNFDQRIDWVLTEEGVCKF